MKFARQPTGEEVLLGEARPAPRGKVVRLWDDAPPPAKLTPAEEAEVRRSRLLGLDRRRWDRVPTTEHRP